MGGTISDLGAISTNRVGIIESTMEFEIMPTTTMPQMAFELEMLSEHRAIPCRR